MSETVFYTFLPQAGDAEPDTLDMAFPDDQAAIDGARAILESYLSNRPGTFLQGSISVGRGVDPDIHWLGIWEWGASTGYEWCPDS